MSFSELLLQDGYSSALDNVLDEFYKPAINKASVIKRAVGYFRSTVYMLMHEEILEFVKRKGQIQLICSMHLSNEDIQELQDASDSQIQDHLGDMLLDEITQIATDLAHSDHTKVLSGLIKIGALDIRIAVKKEGTFHDKRGLLFDAYGQVISFVGSGNETFSAWGGEGNSENFEVFCSWKPDDASRVRRHQLEYDKLIANEFRDVTIYSLSDAFKRKLIKSAPHDEDELFQIWKHYQQSPSQKKSKTPTAPRKYSAETDDFPSGRQLQPHQRTALEAWQANQCRGILELATGAGKTFIGINAIRAHIRQGKLAIVAVPSKILLHDWHEELASEIPEAKFLLLGDGHRKWKKEGVVRRFSGANEHSRRHIIIGINDTVRSEVFLRRLRNLSHIFLVSDEVHTLGSPENQNIFHYDFGHRLGLSATPERYGDEEGTHRLFDYFAGKVGTPFTLEDAQKAGRLVNYNYYPEYVYLSEEEKDHWQEVTLKIRKAFAMQSNKETEHVSDNYLKKLMIQRARIAKNAVMKLRICFDILRNHYQPNSYWLIYCDNQIQIADLKVLLAPLNLPIFVYHSAMSGCRDSTLEHFKRTSGVLIAINCLDEGVDIPPLEYGIIIASSQNPRQFIQRRGRLLRATKTKTLAHIWDVLVIPDESYSEEDAQLQDSLTNAELRRALEFGKTALNQERISEHKRKMNTLNIQHVQEVEFDEPSPGAYVNRDFL